MSRLHHNFKVGPHRDLTILQRRLNGRPDIGQFIAETPTVWRALNAWLERAGKLTRAELLPEMPIVETGRLDEVKIAAFLLTIFRNNQAGNGGRNRKHSGLLYLAREIVPTGTNSSRCFF